MPSIIEVAQQAGSLNTFLEALETAGINDILNGPGPFTLFAPTDEAFSKLPQVMFQHLLNDAPRLKEILLYHLIPGEYTEEDVLEKEEMQTVQGQCIQIDEANGLVIDDAKVMECDINADNGIIHIIDGVIMPRVTSKV